jgi:hypothetical protein
LIGSLWLNLFSKPDYFCKIAEFFTKTDEALILLKTSKDLNAAVRSYFQSVRPLREVGYKVFDWLHMAAIDIAPSLMYQLHRPYRGFNFYAVYKNGRYVLLWAGCAQHGIFRIVDAPAKAPEVVSTVSIIPQGNGRFSWIYELTNQLQPSLNRREVGLSADLKKILDDLKPILTIQLQHLSDEMKLDDDFNDPWSDEDSFFRHDEFEYEFGDAPTGSVVIKSQDDAIIQDVAIIIEEAPEVVVIKEDPEIIIIEDAPEIIIIEDVPIEVLADEVDAIVVD